MSLSAEQRSARLTRVGASEVAALLDPPEHPYITKRDIYARLVSGAEPEANQPMQVGQLLEPYVLMAARRFYRLRAIACTRAYTHPTLPVTASPDAYIADGDGLLEVKVTSNAWMDDLPAYVVAQVQCQLWLAQRSYAHVVVLNGSRLELFTLERDQDRIDAIEAGVARFYVQHLVPNIAPPGPSREFTLERIAS